MSVNNQESYPLLDQLQGEVNRVLEQTGRVLAASNDNKTVPAVPVSKLKQLLPGSMNRFHEALDELEDELQLAHLVMRRDFAKYRERAGISQPIKINGTASTETVQQEAVTDSKPSDAVDGDQIATTEDVSMQDIQQTEAAEPAEQSDKANAAEKANSKEEAKDGDTKEPPANSKAEPDPSQPESNPSGPELQIDTHNQSTETDTKKQSEEDKPPDTATNDLDSLFGGATSAGPAPDFTDDFDFTSFGENNNTNVPDNDNISALLPGLQDYANTQPNASGEPNFDALFTDLNTDGQATGEQHDSTFDDLMDFADFNAGDFGEGNGGNANQEFDFSFD